ncbi:hypothetical protein LTR66_000379 [Elasticomyces elasticus]|nr:hypothetical protein LTR66_000379 [Elasticomyces elasticus]
MAQGAVKKSKPAAPRKPASLGPKRGARVIKPKKSALIKQQKMNKKHTSGLTAMTERSLAEKAGHLEMLRGGKKDSNGKTEATGPKSKKAK